MIIIAVSTIQNPIAPHTLRCCTAIAYTREVRRVDGGYVVTQSPALGGRIYKTRANAQRAIDRAYGQGRV